MFGIDCFGDFVYGISYTSGKPYGSVCYYVSQHGRYRRSYMSIFSLTLTIG